jgi:streptomycin 6-kinase
VLAERAHWTNEISHRVSGDDGDVDTFPLPVNLVDGSARNSDPTLGHWVAELPRIVPELAAQWSLRLGEPFQPGGQGSWVAPVLDQAGRDLVLKVGWRHTEALHEAEGLAWWAGNGTVLLHAAQAYDSTSALLLERCLPGTPLSLVVAEPEQDVVVADLLRRLWPMPPEGHPFRPLQQMCDEWADEFEMKRAHAPASIDPGLAAAGMELLRSLPGTATTQALVCTDLHAENILTASREPWLVIDPKPYVGDPAYDPLQHMLNCAARLLADPMGLVRRMAGLLDLDPDRLALWLFARCVQECIDQPWLRDVAAQIAPA